MTVVLTSRRTLDLQVPLSNATVPSTSPADEPGYPQLLLLNPFEITGYSLRDTFTHVRWTLSRETDITFTTPLDFREGIFAVGSREKGILKWTIDEGWVARQAVGCEGREVARVHITAAKKIVAVCSQGNVWDGGKWCLHPYSVAYLKSLLLPDDRILLFLHDGNGVLISVHDKVRGEFLTAAQRIPGFPRDISLDISRKKVLLTMKDSLVAFALRTSGIVPAVFDITTLHYKVEGATLLNTDFALAIKGGEDNTKSSICALNLRHDVLETLAQTIPYPSSHIFTHHSLGVVSMITRDSVELYRYECPRISTVLDCVLSASKKTSSWLVQPVYDETSKIVLFQTSPLKGEQLMMESTMDELLTSARVEELVDTLPDRGSRVFLLRHILSRPPVTRAILDKVLFELPPVSGDQITEMHRIIHDIFREKEHMELLWAVLIERWEEVIGEDLGSEDTICKIFSWVSLLADLLPSLPHRNRQVSDLARRTLAVFDSKTRTLSGFLSMFSHIEEKIDAEDRLSRRRVKSRAQENLDQTQLYTILEWKL